MLSRKIKTFFLILPLFVACSKNDTKPKMTLDELVSYDLKLFSGIYDGLLHQQSSERIFGFDQIKFNIDGTYNASVLTNLIPAMWSPRTGIYDYDPNEQLISFPQIDTISTTSSSVFSIKRKDWRLTENNDSLLIFQKETYDLISNNPPTETILIYRKN